MGCVCGQNSFLSTVSPSECFCLSAPATHFSFNLLRIFFKSSVLNCVLILWNCSIQSSETGCPIHLCEHTANAGPLHIFIPGISSSDTCCLALLTQLTMLLQRLFLYSTNLKSAVSFSSSVAIPSLSNVSHLSLFSRPFLTSLIFFVYYW